jgi:uncharacterized protein YhhL (DUF1145 family)
MFRSFFSLAALLLSIACVILLHTIELLEDCMPEHKDTQLLFLAAYANAVVWMALFLFLCLPFVRSLGKCVRVNTLPPLLTTLSSTLLLIQLSYLNCSGERFQSVLFCAGSTLTIALLLFFSELGCPRGRSEKYEPVA